MLASKSRSNQEDTPLPERRRVGEDVPAVGVRLNLRHQSRAAALGPVRAPGPGEPGVLDRPRRVRGAVAQEAPAAGARINEVERADAADPRVPGRGEESKPAAHAVPYHRDARGIGPVPPGGER